MMQSSKSSTVRSSPSSKLRAKTAQDESGLWGQMNRMTAPGIKAHRCEARTPSGFPDVLWWYPTSGTSCVGLLELKDNVNLIRPEQRIFLYKARMDGQSAYVLLRIGTADDGELKLIDPMKIKASDLRIDTPEPALTIDITKLGKREAWGRLWDYLIEEARGTRK